ncbi:MAG TPA: tryptophan 2,3-dioxygenase family protein [Streptosporangiaceae bacterium]|jgi:tryptophan 2,3-dioxygenase
MRIDKILKYDAYLRLSSLLDQQRPVGAEPAHDELSFITIHQVCELWFKVLLYELTDARDRMLEGETYLPRVRLRRCLAIQRVLHDQMNVLDTMTPRAFQDFRGALGGASGFQSVQFREIEFISGLKDPHWPARMRGLSAADRVRLRRRLAEPTLWDGFLAVLAASGFDVSDRSCRYAAYDKIEANPEEHAALWELAHALVEHDQAWSLWRSRHALVAERQIGGRPGTGGSAGVAYLRARVDHRFYPELWDAWAAAEPELETDVSRAAP